MGTIPNNYTEPKCTIMPMCSLLPFQLSGEIFEFGSRGQVTANGSYESTDSDLPKTTGGLPLTLIKKSNDKITHH